MRVNNTRTLVQNRNKGFGNTFENPEEKQNSDRIPDEVFILADEL